MRRQTNRMRIRRGSWGLAILVLVGWLPVQTALAADTVGSQRYGYTLELPDGWTSLWETEDDFQQARVRLPDGTLTSAEGLGFTMAAQDGQGNRLFLRQIEMDEQTANAYINSGASEPDAVFLQAIGLDSTLGQPLHETGSQRFPSGLFTRAVGANGNRGRTEIAYGYAKGRLMVLIHLFDQTYQGDPISYVLYSLQAQTPAVYFPTLDDCRWSAQWMDEQAWQALAGTSLPSAPPATPMPTAQEDGAGAGFTDIFIFLIIYGVPAGLLIGYGIVGLRIWMQHRRRQARMEQLRRELPPITAQPRKRARAATPPAHRQPCAPSPSSEETPRFCRTCGKLLTLEDRFCSRCGTPVQPEAKGI